MGGGRKWHTVKRYHVPRRGYVGLPTSQNKTPAELEHEEAKARQEVRVLKYLRDRLIEGVEVVFTNEALGRVRGHFVQFKPGPRIMVKDSVSGVPYTCWPSEVISPRPDYRNFVR